MLILNRVINPSSKLESVSWTRNTAYPLFTELTEKDLNVNRIYESMDKFHENMDLIMEDFYKISGEIPSFSSMI